MCSVPSQTSSYRIAITVVISFFFFLVLSGDIFCIGFVVTNMELLIYTKNLLHQIM